MVVLSTGFFLCVSVHDLFLGTSSKLMRLFSILVLFFSHQLDEFCEDVLKWENYDIP